MIIMDIFNFVMLAVATILAGLLVTFYECEHDLSLDYWKLMILTDPNIEAHDALFIVHLINQTFDEKMHSSWIGPMSDYEYEPYPDI